jgi:hypothetical protein
VENDIIVSKTEGNQQIAQNENTGNLSKPMKNSLFIKVKIYLYSNRKEFNLPNFVGDEDLKELREEKSRAFKDYTLDELMKYKEYYNEQAKYSFGNCISSERGILQHMKEEMGKRDLGDKIFSIPETIVPIIGAAFVNEYNKMEKYNVMVGELSKAIENYQPPDTRETKNKLQREDGIVNCFERKGVVWEIVYDGKRISLPETVGLRYIAMLLSLPKRHIYCRDLLNPTMAKDNCNDYEVLKTKNTMDGWNERMIDTATLADIRKTIKNLEEKIEEAKNTEGGELQVEEYEDQLEKLKHYLMNGRYENIGEPSSEKNMTNAVGKSIKDAIKRIRKYHEGLANHLDFSIREKGGRYPVYFPEKEIPWRVKF